MDDNGGLDENDGWEIWMKNEILMKNWVQCSRLKVHMAMSLGSLLNLNTNQCS
jgi:hypothetical protein